MNISTQVPPTADRFYAATQAGSLTAGTTRSRHRFDNYQVFMLTQIADWPSRSAGALFARFSMLGR
jgi:hypothetical protein